MILNNPPYTEMLQLLRTLSYRHSTWEVFTDFVEMSALSISNSVDTQHFEEREKQYLHTINKYEKEEREVFPKMFAYLVEALEHELAVHGLTDVLGVLFHDLELHNKYKGQFFTPQHICTMMGKISVDKNDQAIKEQGYISACEPCAGSGAMALGFAQAMKECGLNYCGQLVVTATDIDPKCVHMCYIQLALYGIPAVVIHGNTITLEEWSRWYTPLYLLGGWSRKMQERSAEETPTAEGPQPPAEPFSEQLSLFED